MKFWDAENTMVGWRFGLIVPVLITLLFFDFAMPIGILLAGLAVVFLFFLGLNYFSTQWVQRSFDQLEVRIFFIALLVRIVFLGYLYLLTFWFDPDSFPFEINAADSWVYHNVTLELIDAPVSEWLDIVENRMKSRSDFGYPIYQGTLYSLFGPYTLIVRFFNSVIRFIFSCFFLFIILITSF